MAASLDKGLVSTLTEREREVLVLMARDLDNGQIAAELFVSEATVRTHVGPVVGTGRSAVDSAD
jgi:DNA-binding NarL/FixJ family response regulator